MLALFFKFFGVYAASAGEIALEEAVHHHVGIAAYGRSEVCVVFESESVVADIDGGVYGFSHRTYGQCGEEVFLAFAFYVDKHTVQGAVDLARFSFRFKLVAECPAERCQICQPVGVGGIVDAINESLCFFLCGGYAYFRSDCLVGEEHEFLDQLVGVF